MKHTHSYINNIRIDNIIRISIGNYKMIGTYLLIANKIILYLKLFKRYLGFGFSYSICYLFKPDRLNKPI